ncbi:MAG: flavin reductase family protein [Candidatus Diapherotrites archaeon]|nr:flavin reductase family protein [Candidatus Diapherotrites archaeon]
MPDWGAKTMKINDFFKLMSPKLTVLVTTIDEKGRPEVSTFSFVSPVSFEPPLLMISVGPNKHSYWNLTRVKEFVVNIPSEKMLEKVWEAGGKYDPGESKIEKFGFKTIPSDKVRPPRLADCPAQIECYEEFSKQAGDHIMLLGRVVAVHADDEFVDSKGNLKVDVVRPPLHVSDNLFAFPYVTKSV